MNKSMSKRQQDIRSKLMAAIAMLLVSSIMMVSTTYAWFTLSTAPEVTGISTSVGANGNLEMALLPASGLVSDIGAAAVGDSSKAQDVTLANKTWGNLVDVSDASYGMSQITLYPSELNVAGWDDANLNPESIATILLKTPAYGPDGRVSDLKPDTTTSTFDDVTDKFPQNSDFGVRAVGAASGMTDRQLAYRNSRSMASTAMTQAKSLAASSLNTNGVALGNIAVAKATNKESYSDADVRALMAIVNDLLGVEGGKTGVLQYVENAYKQYIIAYAASAACAPVYSEGENPTLTSGMTDEMFNAFANAINDCTTLDGENGVLKVLENHGVSLSSLTGPMNQLIATKATVMEVKNGHVSTGADDPAWDGLQDLLDSGVTSFTWEQISTPLNKLANMDKIKVGDYTVQDIKNDLNLIIGMVSGGSGITVNMATGGGVYADIADHCGDYTASVTLTNIQYNSITIDKFAATMATQSTLNPNYYLTVLSGFVTNAGAPAGGSGQIMPISDFYGYIVDMAFRTNASGSNLLLQTDAVDRIYSDNGNTAETMGHGSTMTFVSVTNDFTTDQMKNLMRAIRIVFFDPTNLNVMATAMLDMDNNVKVTGGNTVTAKMFLYENMAAAENWVEATEGATHIQVANYDVAVDSESATHYKTADSEEYIVIPSTGTVPDGATLYTFKNYTYTEAATGATHKLVKTAGGAQMQKDQTKASITALDQNVAKAVSVLVYLDGNLVTNADVAATATTSMTGSMNLQFASSATLKPMVYTPLVNTVSQAETYSVVTPSVTGVSFSSTSAEATQKTAFTFSLTNSNTKAYTVSYMIDEGQQVVLGTLSAKGTETDAPNVTKEFTVPADAVTGQVTVFVTEVTGA